MVNWGAIEEKWQRRWEEAHLFEADPDPDRPKFYITVAYPYPNSPQHIGHGRTYTLADVHARYRRMQGYRVLLPMAWHYTGTPIIAMIERLKEGDRDLIETFTEIYHIPRERLRELETAIGMAQYFTEEIKHGMKRMGYSIDWRREFTTIDPYYSKFIEWQFEKLRQRGYITQGSHPVGWCPHCGNPVGQHDTVGDVEPEMQEFTAIKFRAGRLIYPTATLRPETIFGVTNLWVHPDATYVRARVDDETWVVSETAAEKLIFLGHSVEVLERFKGVELVGERVVNPATGSEKPILPAEFVDPDHATGVVMSVPAHAPYDYVALKRLEALSKSTFRKMGLRPGDVRSVKPISIIEVPGYGKYPAADVVERMGIIGESDSRLEEATKEVYGEEFRNGLMKGNTGSYAGMRVEAAREAVRKDLIADGKAITIYELIRPVQCRCGAEVVVKIFENQWFINYGDLDWKRIVHENLNEMTIIPREFRQEFENVIDWLKAKACARKVGMGTRLPWSPDWIIEALSDSTIYMAYYTVVRHLKRLRPDPETLDVDFWDLIFLGEGSSHAISERTGIPIGELEKMREEFLYFYPLDARHSGRDLIPNHLTFMIFNHTAIFPREFWPRGIYVNGSVLMEGQKMSKSLKNIIPLIEAVREFGADPLRLSLMATAEPIKDADFSRSLARSMRETLERLYERIMEAAQHRGDPSELRDIDRWMLSRLQRHIAEATEAMEVLRVRKAIHAILYDMHQDLDWYLRRVAPERRERGKAIQYVLRKVAETQVRMLAPFTPHLCEELWEALEGGGFVSTAPWPEAEEAEMRPDLEEKETIIKACLEDIQHILRVTGIEPRHIRFYTATTWKWKVYLKALELAVRGELEVGSLIRECFRDEELRVRAREVPEFARGIVEDVVKTPEERLKTRLQMGVVNELRILQDAVEFLKAEFGCDVSICGESDPWIIDPEDRAKRAKPYRSAIYIE